VKAIIQGDETELPFKKVRYGPCVFVIKMNVGAFGVAECGILKCLCILYRGRFDFRRLSPCMVREMDNSIKFQNDYNKARFQGILAKSIVEEKEREKVVGDQDKQDNALKASTFLFSLCQLRYALCSIRYASI
jgi:hypothetical protein